MASSSRLSAPSSLSVKLQALHNHWIDFFNQVEIVTQADRDLLYKFLQEHADSIVDLEQKLAASYVRDDEKHSTALSPIARQDRPSVETSRTHKSTASPSTRSASLAPPTTAISQSPLPQSHPFDEHPSDEDYYNKYLNSNGGGDDDDESMSLLVEDWKMTRTQSNRESNRAVVSHNQQPEPSTTARTTTARVVSYGTQETKTPSSRKSIFSSSHRTSIAPGSGHCSASVQEQKSTHALSSAMRESASRKKNSYSPRTSIAPGSGHRSASSAMREAASRKENSYSPQTETIVSPRPLLTSREDHRASQSSCYEPGAESIQQQRGGLNISSVSCINDDEEDSVSSPTPTVLQDIDEPSQASRTVIRERHPPYESPKLPSKPFHPSSLVKENLMSPTHHNISCLTNASFLSGTPHPGLRTVREEDDDTTTSVETPVLDRYRVAADSKAPYGFKVVPNPRRCHRKNKHKKRDKETTPRSSLLLYARARMAVPRVRPIQKEEFHNAPRLVHLQTTLQELNDAIANLNESVAAAAAPSEQPFSHAHMTESEALKIMASPRVLRTLCHFKRLSVRAGSTGERILDLVLE